VFVKGRKKEKNNAAHCRQYVDFDIGGNEHPRGRKRENPRVKRRILSKYGAIITHVGV